MRILENESLRVSVSDEGAELCSVVDKESGEERIWTADPAYWNRHAPILFPFVGKSYSGKYRIGEKTFDMKTQHGFARDLTFACEQADAGMTVHSLAASEKTKEIYPYDFRLSVTHALDADNPRALHVYWTVENQGKEEMLFSIGAHPGFLLKEGMKKEDTLFFFPGQKELRYYSVNSGGYALEDTVYTVRPEAGFVPFGETIGDTWIFDNGQVREASICQEDGTPFVTMYCPGFPLFAVWSKPGSPFICLEPWFGRTDPEGFDGTIREKTGIQILNPGETRTYHYGMVFHKA